MKQTKYHNNLRTDGDKVYSYNTLVAKRKDKNLVVLGWWSRTTTKHIKHIAFLNGLKVVRKPTI